MAWNLNKKGGVFFLRTLLLAWLNSLRGNSFHAFPRREDNKRIALSLYPGFAISTKRLTRTPEEKVLTDFANWTIKDLFLFTHNVSPS
jgi:hypothetical protein